MHPEKLPCRVIRINSEDEVLAQLYQLAHSNGDFQGVPARKRESDQWRAIANRL